MKFIEVARLLPLVLLAGCAAPKQQTALPTPAPRLSNFVFPNDDLGRPITLKAPAKRVIVIGPGAIETMFAIGADKQLVGRDNFASVPPAAKKVAVAGDFQGPNVEQSIALRPDLIIVQGETYDRARVENWQNKIGAPVAVLTPRTMQMVREDIEKMGAWTDKTAASKLVADTLGGADASARNPGNNAAGGKPGVGAQSTRATGRTAFIEVGRDPLYTAGPDTLVGNVLEAAGFANAAKTKGYQPYNIESLLAAPPDVYIVTSDKPKAQILAELRKSPTLSKLKCVRDGEVIVVKGDLILRPGPRLKQGIEELRGRATGSKSQD